MRLLQVTRALWCQGVCNYILWSKNEVNLASDGFTLRHSISGAKGIGTRWHPSKSVPDPGWGIAFGSQNSFSDIAGQDIKAYGNGPLRRDPDIFVNSCRLTRMA